MTAWTRDELDKIGTADELRLATVRPDGGLRDPVTIWVVRHGDDLYIRSYRGPGGSWFRHAGERREGRIQAGGVDRDVTLADASHQFDDQIDAAYRAKYSRYSGTYVDPMVAPQARATTIRLVPRADGRAAILQTVIMTMRLRTSCEPSPRPSVRNNRHISCGSEHTRLQRRREGWSVMAVWSWLRPSAGRWLLRQAVRWTRWLLLAVAVLAAWPVTLVASVGYLTAWLRGWPPARLYRAAAWALPVTAVGLVILEIRTPGWVAARTPGRGGARGWDHLAAADLARVFLLLVPVTVPAGLALAGLIWAWRIDVVTAGIGYDGERYRSPR